MLAADRTTHSEIRQIEEEITKRGKSLRGVQRLLQVHGLNLLSAISLLAEIGDIGLFDTSKQLVSYAGLATSTKQSSETTRHGALPNGDGSGCAQSASGRCWRWSIARTRR